MPSAASIPARSQQARLRLLQAAGRALAPRAVRGGAGLPERVLLLRPDHIGDVLLNAPAVALLRASLPDAQLVYVVGPWSQEAARRGPAVNELRVLAFPGFTRRSNANVLAPYALLAREAARVRRERFDLAVVLRPDHWWGALLALAAGIAVRVGGATPETTPLLTHSYLFGPAEHTAERGLGIARLALRAIGAREIDAGAVCQFSIDPEAERQADFVWRRYALTDRRVVMLHPAAGAPLKSWPVRRWAELADALSGLGCSVVLSGAPGDAPLLSNISASSNSNFPRLCGQSLEVSAALYARSALFVSVDSGAAHLAAGVGTATVRLFGPAPPSVFGPWPARSDQQVLATSHLACAPCGYLEGPPCGAQASPACMLALGVEDVVNAVKRQLDRS